MSTPSMSTDDTLARAEDTAQAAYFRGALVDRKAIMSAEIGRQYRRLNSLSTRSDAWAISQLRREIRANEAECRELDRMIEALDRRFSSLSVSRP